MIVFGRFHFGTWLNMLSLFDGWLMIGEKMGRKERRESQICGRRSQYFLICRIGKKVMLNKSFCLMS